MLYLWGTIEFYGFLNARLHSFVHFSLFLLDNKMNNNNNDDTTTLATQPAVDPDERPDPLNVQTLRMMVGEDMFSSKDMKKRLEQAIAHPCSEFPIAWNRRDELKCRLRTAFLTAYPELHDSEMGFSDWTTLWKFIRFIIKNCDKDELELLAWKNIIE